MDLGPQPVNHGKSNKTVLEIRGVTNLVTINKSILKFHSVKAEFMLKISALKGAW